MTPGCFGIPSIFSFTSRVCGKCSHFQTCRVEAHAALKAAPIEIVRHQLRAHEDYCRAHSADSGEEKKIEFTRKVAPSKKVRSLPKKIDLTDAQKAMLEALPAKVSGLLSRLMKRGVDTSVLLAAQHGNNGFDPAKHRSLHLALDMLLEGGITKPALRTAFVEKLGWAETSAFAECTLIWKVFPLLKLAVEQGASLVPGPGVRCKNESIHKRTEF